MDFKVTGMVNKVDGQLIGEDGTKYSNLNSKEIDRFCEAFRGDKSSREMGEIYEHQIPKISFDVEAIVSGVRNKVLNG